MKVKAKAVLGQLSDMDLRLLRVFKSVADCGGMAAAGLELNIGISTVSRHVKDLEQRLQLTLCSRGRGGFALTTEGERIYEETQRLLASADAFRASVDDIHQRMGGQLHVAVFDKTASNPACRISGAIALFAQRAPDVALNFHVATLNMIERGVIDGQYQIGVIPAHRSSDSLIYDRLFGETMLLYCGERHPLFASGGAKLGWEDLRRYQFAGLGYHSPNMEISQQVRLPRKATGFDQESIATLILSGQYLGFLPDHYAKGFVADGKMRAVHPKLFRYDCEFVAILRGSPQPSRIASAFRACLLEAHRPRH
ncbi:LysR family transcriptional regulator [Pseudoduganella ginsengisoli]|uniref:LysR family transcriptional regulator n=1 Tax=Pseudoduganella ginsengisoli TaxID=1462440 RepID=A0A6L6PWT2_9BURK|nr:LysR family transcriptional regulator [Pseudoduganella ginsengisoli]MTW01679.1 LysR family transcriptional regulator [Pseudoduganella ginsengisoli]